LLAGVIVVSLALFVVTVALWVRACRGGDRVTLGRHGQVVLASSCDGLQVETFRGRPDEGRAWSWVRGEAMHDPAAAAAGFRNPLTCLAARSRAWRGFGFGKAEMVCEVDGRAVERGWVRMPHWYVSGVVGLVGLLLGSAALRARR
jgi:hypothetical protein